MVVSLTNKKSDDILNQKASAIMAEVAEVIEGIKQFVDRSGLVIQRVDSAGLLNQVLGLRYQVYCKERDFINPQNCISGIESDKYDSHAVHFSASDQYGVIGTVRLVLDSPNGFPIEEHCRGKLDIDINKSFRKEAAEISRLVISKYVRRRSVGARQGSNELSDNRPYSGLELFIRRHKPIALGMYREIYIETKSRNIKYWFALMEKPLHALLNIYGFEFKPIGGEVDLGGAVTPYMANVKDIEKVLRERFSIFVRK